MLLLEFMSIFTSMLNVGQRAIGPFYKAQMSTGEAIVVKVLETDFKQGDKEFQTEVVMNHSHIHLMIVCLRLILLYLVDENFMGRFG
ncbi:hypothetical protein Hanom_Chr16g01464651 [Helianthus anomalus]